MIVTFEGINRQETKESKLKRIKINERLNL